ncbi:hypothetical protein LRM64_10175 [Prescottella equi]|uniref:hypothetical protein n=1 Tax=Rhodococcus hoagii TaxID=43767 RepID=UPI0019DE40B3|nr:hypothetical protein [Prescottella equi]MBM4592263.1 hypothetical protein [Prescottella equi]MBM4596129.1 hypothetical protein [Prescottella equi]MCU7531913.1 hypothetical protein [Prescottella equi]MCU7534045.1 hypothetical protein [Prescottella equi]NKW12985.1 hypothetical protein [Prescottella equi]
MSAADIDEALDDLLDALPPVEGFEPWREVGPEEWFAARRTHLTAALEIVPPNGEPTAAHLIALPTNTIPVFDDGAAADRAHDAAVDQQNGVV